MESIIKVPRIKPYRSDTQKAFVEGWATCAKMKELLSQGRGAEIAEDVQREFKRATHYGFNKLAAEFANFLTYHYFNLLGEHRRGEKYSELALHYSELSGKEDQVAVIFARQTYMLNNARGYDENRVNELSLVCEELKTYLQYDSVQIWIQVHMLLNQLAYMEERYEDVIDQSMRVIAFLEERGLDRTASFWKDMTPALIRMGEYTKAREAINNAILNINKGSLSWSVFLYYRLVLELHEGNFQKAYRIFEEANRKRQINKSMNDTWLVVKGYLNFLSAAGKLSEGNTSFKLGKFLNDFTVMSSDKAGLNINIIILKILLRLQSDRGRIIDERERIERYVERYLKEGSRERLFFQMLHQLVPGDFSRAKVSERAERYFERLRVQRQHHPEIEMVKYEDLWGMVLGLLDD